jgi:hypothetical protein
MYIYSYVCISYTQAGKVVPVHVRETSKGSRVRSISLVIFNFGTRRKGVVSFPHRPHSSREGKKTEYPLNRTVDRHRRSGGFEEEKGLFLLLKF